MKPVRYHHGDLQNALVGEALDLARLGGERAVTVRAAARGAGVSHAAAYRHFRSRRALLASVATEGMNRLAAVLEEATHGDPPLQRFRSLVAAYLSWAFSNPGVFHLAFSQELWDKETLPRLREASDRASRPVLDAAADHLGPSAAEGEARRLAVAAWALAHGFAVLALNRQLTQGELSVAGQVPALVDLAGDAVCVLAGGWPGGS
ncbi:MAG: TetR/AcrR family transcriptional regulator [Gemmatimonadota bacterium]|nr:TetR/AcrR family transcriptional regulator [Gemmatimonadota bacterium]